ncbi:4Fe-4S ferredoxin [Thermogladius sp. 4427co]|uniref:4Fe-4S ferredoxin n=1 Tax=Thermogladius sp. 4427co TaxID=3450718 RepID=UPI003F79BE28
MVYSIPKLIDINARSRLIRDCRKLLIIGRCIEVEHYGILKNFIDMGYCPLSVCLEAEHVNMVGFKLAGILARGSYDEVAVLTVDGSLHCTQLHWMVEEVFKIMNLSKTVRKHYVVYEGEVKEISPQAVKTSRFLYKVENLIQIQKGSV